MPSTISSLISHTTKDPAAIKRSTSESGRQWERWEVSAWARNLFDEDYATRGFFFGNEPPNFAPTVYTKFGDPRHYGVSLAYRY